MFTATARAARTIPTGYEIDVEYVRERDDRLVLKSTYKVADKVALKVAVDAQLRQLLAGEDDAAIAMDVVGKVISRI